MIKSKPKAKQQAKPAAKATPKPVLLHSIQEARERKSALMAGTAAAPAADKPQVKAPRLKFIRHSRLARLMGVDPSTVWRWWRKDDVLPPPYRIGGIVGWWENQLVDLLEKRQLTNPEQED